MQLKPGGNRRGQRGVNMAEREMEEERNGPEDDGPQKKESWPPTSRG